MNAVTLEVLDKKIAELAHERDVLARQLERAEIRASKEQYRIDGWYVIWKPPPGFDISDACRLLQAHADVTNEAATMSFNDTEVTARPGGNAADVRDAWMKKRRGQ